MTSTVDTGSALTFEVQQPIILLGYGTAARIAAPRFATLRVILQAQRVTTAANTQQNDAQRFRAILECLSTLAALTGEKIVRAQFALITWSAQRQTTLFN